MYSPPTVSIHAPVPGATNSGVNYPAGQIVSIHAPVPGATFEIHRWPSPKRVSIHAPVPGATLPQNGQKLETIVSIHAPVPGATIASMIARSYRLFQSTLPYRERRKSTIVINVCQNSFNPRSRTGSDFYLSSRRPVSSCFNPRSRTGSDERLRRQRFPICCFNPRSRTGSDRKRRPFLPRLPVSIHAPVPGATKKVIIPPTSKMFQSTLPYRERRLFHQIPLE